MENVDTICQPCDRSKECHAQEVLDESNSAKVCQVKDNGESKDEDDFVESVEKGVCHQRNIWNVIWKVIYEDAVIYAN